MCALLVGKWAAEQLGSIWPGLAALGECAFTQRSLCFPGHTLRAHPMDRQLHEDVWETQEFQALGWDGRRTRLSGASEQECSTPDQAGISASELPVDIVNPCGPDKGVPQESE